MASIKLDTADLTDRRVRAESIRSMARALRVAAATVRTAFTVSRITTHFLQLEGHIVTPFRGAPHAESHCDAADGAP
jgi:hypothetical protein